MLSDKGSISSTLFLEWGLSRPAIKGALLELFYNRRLQVTLASILTGTRFKFFDKLMGGGNIRMPTVCCLCGQRDSPAHIMAHAGISSPPDTLEDVIPFLVQMAITANTVNPHISVPYVEPMAIELELEEMEDSEEESDLASLSFDEGPAI